MNTELATAMVTQPECEAMIKPNGKREALLFKLQDIQINNKNTNREGYYGVLVDQTSRLFIQLCKTKLGISADQLKKLGREELDELALLIYEKSRKFYYIQTGLYCILPIIGWICLLCTHNPDMMPTYITAAMVRNRRYFLWYQKIRKLSDKNFSPDITIEKFSESLSAES